MTPLAELLRSNGSLAQSLRTWTETAREQLSSVGAEFAARMIDDLDDLVTAMATPSNDFSAGLPRSTGSLDQSPRPWTETARTRLSVVSAGFAARVVDGLDDLVTEMATAPNDFSAGLPLPTGSLAQSLRPWPETTRTRLSSVGSGLAARINEIDDRYQRWIQTNFDPLLGMQRHQYQVELAGGRDIGMSAMEKSTNRRLALGVFSLSIVGIGAITGLPVAGLSMAIGLYVMWPTFRFSYRTLVHEHRVSVNHLFLVYMAGMWLGGYYAVGSAGVILFSLVGKVAMMCEDNARVSLVNIFGQQPRTAWLLVGEVETEVPIEQVQVGDIVVLDVGQVIPVDGVIVKGMATIDQHMLTGESQPAEKGVGDAALAATVVLAGRIHVRVEKAGKETTVAQIGEVLQNTAKHQLSMQQKAMLIADRSLIPMLVGGGVGLIFAGPVGAIATFGCNFTMMMMGLGPLTMLNVLNQSSKHGILVKDADALEKLPTINAVLFDKTGTLTVERPHVVGIHPCNGLGEDEVLRLAAAAEHRQTHPVAQAILLAAAEQGIAIPPVEDARYEVGYGIIVRLTGTEDNGDTPGLLVCVGSHRFMEMEGVAIPAVMQPLIASSTSDGHSLVFVAVEATGQERQLVGAIQLQATVRSESRLVVDTLRQSGLQTFIISGDQEAPTRALAHDLGMDGYFANVLPEGKAALVEKLKQEGKRVCFIGDGINDAIALKTADVSVSFRGATTAATDTAQIILMDAHLEQFLTVFDLAHEMKKNIDLNFNVALGLSLLSGTGVVFFNMKYALVEALFSVQVATGVGIASLPLLKEAKPEETTE